MSHIFISYSTATQIQLHTEVTIGFPETSYTIREDQQSLSVCVDLIGQTGISLLISIIFNQGGNVMRFSFSDLLLTGIFSTANNDITLESGQVVVFSAISSNRQCFDVDIIPDNFVENAEAFSLSLVTTNSAVRLAPPTTLITITNDDCKSLFMRIPTLPIYKLCNLFLSVAVIQFNQPEYVVSENENEVTICLSTAAGILQRSVSITLSTLQSSAEGL